MSRAPVQAALVPRLLRSSVIRYAMAGGSVSALYFVLFLVTTALLVPRLHYLVVIVGVHCITMLVAFPVYARLVFKVRGRVLGDFIRFWMVYSSGLLASLVGVPFLHAVAQLPLAVAQALVLVAVPCVSFLAHRHWSFRRRPSDEQARR